MIRPFLVCLLLSACTASPVVRSVALPRASVPPSGETPGVVVSPSPVVPQPSSVPGLLPTPVPMASGSSLPLTQPSVPPSSWTLPGFSNGGGGGGGSAPQPTPTPRFYIRDVVMTETGKSVMGVNAPEAIQPVYSDPNPIRLTVTGNFDTNIPFSEPAMRFTFEPGLLHQSFAGETPAVRALLNGVLLLEAVMVTPQRLELLLPQHYLPDLYLQGMHALTLVAGESLQQTTVRLGEPNPPRATLIPVLENATVILAEGVNPPLLRLEGRHFLLQPGWQQLRLEGAVLPIQQIEIGSDGKAVCWAELSADLEPGIYELAYHSPFGITHFSLEIS